jgi:hypothetical protein
MADDKRIMLHVLARSLLNIVIVSLSPRLCYMVLPKHFETSYNSLCVCVCTLRVHKSTGLTQPQKVRGK